MRRSESLKPPPHSQGTMMDWNTQLFRIQTANTINPVQCHDAQGGERVVLGGAVRPTHSTTLREFTSVAPTSHRQQVYTREPFFLEYNRESGRGQDVISVTRASRRKGRVAKVTVAHYKDRTLALPEMARLLSATHSSEHILMSVVLATVLSFECAVDKKG